MSSTCSVLPRDLVSVEIAAEQFGAHPQTLVTSSKFPVHYPVLAPERGPRWQSHAQRRKLNISVRVDQVHLSGALSGACTGKGPQMAIPRPRLKTGNLGPHWPPGTSGNPTGYSCGAPFGGSRLSLVRSGSPGADARLGTGAPYGVAQSPSTNAG
jgi:hypothetical protein